MPLTVNTATLHHSSAQRSMLTTNNALGETLF